MIFSSPVTRGKKTTIIQFSPRINHDKCQLTMCDLIFSVILQKPSWHQQPLNLKHVYL